MNDSRVVKIATLKGPIHIQFIGQLNSVLDPQATGSKVQSMSADADFLSIKLKDSGGRVLDVAVPMSYVTHMVLANA